MQVKPTIIRENLYEHNITHAHDTCVISKWCVWKHYSGVACLPWHKKSPSMRLFAQRFAQANRTETSMLRITSPLRRQSNDGQRASDVESVSMSRRYHDNRQHDWAQSWPHTCHVIHHEARDESHQDGLGNISVFLSNNLGTNYVDAAWNWEGEVYLLIL